MTPEELNAELGNIDLFLLDQILKGRIRKDMKILDAGCGEGRNLLYFFKNRHEVFAIDKNPSAIQMVRIHSRTLKSNIPPDNFIVGEVSEIPLPDQYFDIIVCLNILHFAQGRVEFELMIGELLRILKKGGILLIKMESQKGMENEVLFLEDGIYQTSEGSRRYLLDEKHLTWLEMEKSTALLEPIHYTLINNMSIASLVLEKT